MCRCAEAPSTDAVVTALETALNAHNAASKRPMRLPLCAHAAEHACRAARALRAPRGHLLALGAGGTGRRSLTRLAAFLCGMTVLQVRCSFWRSAVLVTTCYD
jgi:dynein heavy chain, axonemal